MKVEYKSLKEAVLLVLKGLNVPEPEALLVAENLIKAEMRGIDTHGVYLLKLIFERIKAGMISVPTEIRVIKDEGAIGLIDGGNGLGQVAAKGAMERSMEKAKAYGIGLTLVRNTNHIGILAFYSMLAAKEGMIGVIMCNSAPSLPPWGGTRPFFGTNPLSIAVPSEEPIVLDMSMSVVARGKIRRAERLGEKIPVGWALDRLGNPTTDPKEAMKGVLLPIGGPKGFGLAMMVDILSGIVSGSSYGPNINTFHELRGPTGIGVLTMAIDIERFIHLEDFRNIMREYVSSMKQVEKAPGVSKIFMPGEIESEKEKESMKEGIELNDATVEAVNGMLESLGIKYRLEG